MAAVGSTQLEGALDNIDYDMGDSDVDAEGEDDPEVDYSAIPVVTNESSDDDDISDAVSNIEEMDNENEDDPKEQAGVGAVKLPNGHLEDSDEDAVMDEVSDAEDSSVAADDDSDKSSSDGESAAGEEWEGGSDGGEEGEAEVANRNNCV